jgi:hypothetical protein
MLRYLWRMLFGPKLCTACHAYNAATNNLCLYCQMKSTLRRRAG